MTSRTHPVPYPIDDPFFAEVLSDPVARAAYEDAHARNRIIDALVKLRHFLGLTQSQVARRMGVKQPMVSGFETENSDPRLSTIQRYARAVEATAVIRLTLPAICDWIPRSDRYVTVAAGEPAATVTSEPTTERALAWAHSRRRDFVGTA